MRKDPVIANIIAHIKKYTDRLNREKVNPEKYLGADVKDLPKSMKDLFIEELIEGSDIHLDEMMGEWAKEMLKDGKRRVVQPAGNGWEFIIERHRFDDVTVEEVVEKIKEYRKRQKKKARHQRAHERRIVAEEAEKKEKGAKDKFKNKRGLAKVAARKAWYANRNLVEVDDMSKEVGDAMDKEVMNDFDSDCDADDEYVPEPEDRRLIKGKILVYMNSTKKDITLCQT